MQTMTTTIPAAGKKWIDTEGALRRVAGNVGLYHKLLRQFADGQRDAAAQIGAQLAAGDRTTAERTAHSVKGVAGNIGAQQLADAASVLEKTIRAGDNAAPPLQAFREAMMATVEAIDDIAPAQAAAAEPADAPALRAARTLSRDTIRQLIGYLSAGDGAAIECFEQHRTELVSALGTNARRLETAINDFDFETALSVLDEAAGRMNLG